MQRLKNVSRLSVLIAAVLLLLGCGSDETSRDDLPPSAPVMLPRSEDNVYPQQGIRAEPVTAIDEHRVRVEWWANPEEDVAGYRVYRALETDLVHRYVVADLALDVHLPRGLDRYSWVDEGDSTGFSPTRNMLAPDPETGESRGYYWYVVAYDESNNRSPFSEPAYYRLISNPYPLSVVRRGPELYDLNWQYSITSETDRPSYYVIRIYSLDGGPNDVAWFEIAQRYGSTETVAMDLTAPITPMLSDCTYVCQLNAICDRRNIDHLDTLAGAATRTTFTYQH